MAKTCSTSWKPPVQRGVLQFSGTHRQSTNNKEERIPMHALLMLKMFCQLQRRQAVGIPHVPTWMFAGDLT